MRNIFDGEKIEARRIELGLSIAEVCRRAEVCRNTYYKLISGKTLRLPLVLIILQELRMELPQAVKK